MGELDGKVAIVTGAAKGIGEAIAVAYAAEGARVVLADVDEEAGRAVADKLGGDARFVRCDVSREGDWAPVFVSAADLGPVTTLVNNAGIGTPYDDPGAIDEETMDRAIAINQKGVMFGLKHAANAMRGGGGSVVNIASIAALSGGTSGFIYTGTKGAVAAMTRSAALHMGAYGVRVNALAPGIILTPIYEASYPPGVAREVLGHQAATQQPIARLGEGSDVAGPAVFLASDRSSFVTGQVIAVDGGYSASHRGALEAGFAKLGEVMSRAAESG